MLEFVLSGGKPVQIDRHPDRCPICRTGIVPTPIATKVNCRFYQATLEVVYECPNRKCAELFIGYFSGPEVVSLGVRPYYLYKTARPQEPGEFKFEEVIQTTSSAFCEIYNEAHKAEAYGLSHVCGVGYRKSLEFLIKDYLIAKHPEHTAAIKRAALGSCIETYISDPSTKEVAKRATWLGNDETHYQRRWEDKDLTDLKRLIDLVVHWITHAQLTEEAIRSMPPQGVPSQSNQ